MADSVILETELVSAANRDGAHRLVVGAIVAQEGRVLLLKRRSDDFMSGIYELPSGKVEGEETLVQAVRREVVEETGLEVEDVKGLVDSFDYQSSKNELTRQFNFKVSLQTSFELDRAVGLSEHEAFCWAGPTDLDRLPMTESTRRTVKRYFNGSGN